MLKNIILFLLLFFSFIVAFDVKADGNSRCTGGKDNLCSSDFTISVNDISPGMDVKYGGAKKNINDTLGIIIQKLMIGLGSLSLLIMTIGAGYIIMYTGQDELLSKGKSIFKSGIIALVVSLSSYYIVSLLRYLLYN